MPEITQEELDALNKYKELGTVEQVSGTLAGFQQMARTQTINEAAKICGFKPQVLNKLSGNLEIVIKDNAATVKTEAGEVSLSEYAESEWKEFMPSLKAEVQTPTQQYVPFVPQPTKGTDSKPTSLKLARDYIMRTYGQPKTASVN